MDRTSIIGIVLCVILYFGLTFYVEKYYPTPPPKPHPADVAAPNATSPTVASPTPPSISNVPNQTPVAPRLEKTSLLENSAMRISLTTFGAAIEQIELLQHKDGDSGNIILNEESHSNVLALTGWPGADTASFQVTENPPNSVVYTASLPNGLTWERTYTLGQSADKGSGLGAYLHRLFQKIARHLGQKTDRDSFVYTLDVSDTLTNPGATDIALPAYSLSVGRAEPLHNAAKMPRSKGVSFSGTYHTSNQLYLGSGWLAHEFHLTTINNFNPGSVPFLGIKTSQEKDLISSKTIEDAPLRWLGVENQFFAVLLTPTDDHPISYASFQCFNTRDEDGKLVPADAEPDIEASAFFPEINVPAGKSVTLNYNLYAGPKEYDRLNALGNDQGEIMNYGWCEPIILFMLSVIHFWYSLVGNYGVAIILLTLLIKIITWPLVSISNRSGKRMQALAQLPEMKKLKEKHKDDPQKLQTEMWALNKEYEVNPFAGCLPAFVQMPVFISLYYMLQNLSELRGQSFLWVHDLTQPDTIWSYTLSVGLPLLGNHIALNPLPIMVTGLTMVMMRMTPQIGDPQQAKIAQWMPLFFLFIFYNFAAALSLYYVVNNCVSIIQIYRNLKKPMPELKRKPKKK